MTKKVNIGKIASFIFILSLTIPLADGPTWRLVLFISLFLSPILLSIILKNSTLRIITLWQVIAIIVAFSVSAVGNRDHDPVLAISQTITFLAIIAVASGTVWSCRWLSVRQILSIWSIGAIANASMMGGRYEENPWKYGLALPVSIIVLLCLPRSKRLLALLVCVFLGFISGYFSFRAWILIMSIVLVSMVGSMLLGNRSSTSKRQRIFETGVIATLMTVFLAVGNAIGQLALDGRLGNYAGERARMSLETTGNALIGSRAEWGGSLSLFRTTPNGLGLGAIPSGEDAAVAVDGVLLPDVLKTASNVAMSFNSGRAEFHSGLWNNWAIFGLVGLGIIIAMSVVIALTYVKLVINPVYSVNLQVACFVLFAATIWNLLFSPTDPWQLGFCLGIAVWTLHRIKFRQKNEQRVSP